MHAANSSTTPMLPKITIAVCLSDSIIANHSVM